MRTTKPFDPDDEDDHDPGAYQDEDVEPEGVDISSTQQKHAAQLTLLAEPVKPSALEISEHIARQHEPFASWCEDCVAGRGHDDPHRG